ncbi:hypothetical protein VTJ04DRAFT_7193 [Mycothermus thermophilus]|uniref:uncharacterized protein n=1 Tax=Humicola insolens TaxID=85995 RepID=UPI003742D5D8
MKLLTLLVSVGLIASAQAGCIYDCHKQCGTIAGHCNRECVSRCLGYRCPEKNKPENFC